MLVAITRATSIKLAEVGFLLILIAGVWLVAPELAAISASVPPTVQGISVNVAVPEAASR